MANYQSRYTGPEIDERLRKAGVAVLTEAQSLDAGKQAQARENIGAASSAAVDGKYTKPSGGIPKADLASGVQASLGKADTAYQKPQAGIPADDLAPGVIPDVSQFITDDDLSAALEAKQDTISDLADIRSGSQDNVKYTQQTLTNAQKEQARSNIGAGTYDKPDGGIPESDLAQAVKDKLNATEIYPVTYGTTTQTQIAAAVAAGKLPVCKYGDNVYVYAGESSAGYSQFTSILYNTAARIYVKDSTWGNGNFEIYSKPSGGIPKSDLASGVQSSLAKADTALQEHQDISGKADKVSGATSGDFAGLDSNGNLTDSGSKASDFATAAQGAKADSAYQKPQAGIPKTDLSSAVQTSLGLADSAYQKPGTGIPASDLAAGVIPTISTNIQTDKASDAKTASPKAVADYVAANAGSEIYTVAVTVDNNTGTPSASGSVSGGTLSLVFHNLKGATGATGAQGAQGNTGASVDYPYELVNNLTTDDATKGLSAAMGKVLGEDVEALNEVLDMEEVTSTVNVEYTTTNQYIANWTPPVINDNANYRLTNLIHFDKGDIINASGLATGGTSVVLVARYENGTWTKLLVGDTSQTTQSLEYTVEDEGGANIYFGWFKTATPTITKTKTETVAHRLEDLDKIDPLEDSVDALDAEAFTSIEDDLTAGYVDNAYINLEGRVADNNSFAYKVFQVRAGAKITFYTNYANPSAAALAALYVPSPPNELWLYRVLVNGASYEAQTVEYTAPEDMTIAVSFLKTGAQSIKIETSEIESNTINVNALKEDAGHGRLVQDCEFGFMFGKIAVIGDSLASGRVEGIEGQPDAIGSDYKNYSWLSHLARRWRCSELRHYSSAGTNTASWIANWLPVMQADDAICDAYFIALGTNNEYDETNPAGDQTNYEAYISRYNQIIDAVRTKAPHAAIFLMSLYEERNGNANATLEDIAETRMATDKGVYYIDYVNLAKYFRYSVPVNWRGHFSSTGYVYVASAIDRIVNEIIWDNQTEEFWQQFAKYHNGTNPQP